MKVQVSLTVHESKRLIAKAVAGLPEVKRALAGGRILLKGGTTVSAVAEELAGRPLKIAGRITPLGTKSYYEPGQMPHCALLRKGVWENVDGKLKHVVAELQGDDVAVIGANILDVHRNAAMMIGQALGGEPGTVVSGIMGQGCRVIIPVGLEKLIPGTVAEAVRAAGRAGIEKSMGMAVGLVPLMGTVVTEVDALQILAGVSCTVIGRGGICGAEGGTTILIEGEFERVETAWRLVKSVKGSGISGDPQTIRECERGSSNCRNHLGCIYRSKVKDKD